MNEQYNNENSMKSSNFEVQNSGLQLNDINIEPNKDMKQMNIQSSDFEFGAHARDLKNDQAETFWQFLQQQGEHGEISRKGIKLAMFLCFVSLSCLLIGTIEELNHWDPTEGLSFIILCVLSGLPGFFVLHNLVKAWKEPDDMRRRRILQAIQI